MAGSNVEAGDGAVAGAEPAGSNRWRVDYVTLPGGPDRVAAARRLLPTATAHPALERLTTLAARLLRASAAQVVLLTDVHNVAAAAGSAADTVGRRSPMPDYLCSLALETGGALVVADARTDARVAGLPPVREGKVRSYLGAPLVADGGHIVGVICVFGPEARDWSDGDMAVLSHLADSAVAELELTALTGQYEIDRVTWELAVRAGEIGSFDWDLVTGRLSWDDRLIELFGYDRTTFTATIEAFNVRVHPDDLPGVTDALERAIADCGEYIADYRIVHPDGSTRWLTARGRALCDHAGSPFRLVGVAYDISDRREREAHVARVLEAMPTAFFSLSPDWRFTYVNAQAERLLGRPRSELVGADVWEMAPEVLRGDGETQCRHAMTSGEPVTFEAHSSAPVDAWYEVRAWPSPEGLSVYFLDISERRSAQLAAERAALRAALLGDVTAELAETLEPETAVARLAGLVVPALADWCLVTLADDGEHAGDRRGLRDVGFAHVDEQLLDVLSRYAALRLGSLREDAPLLEALRSGRPVVRTSGASPFIASGLEDGEVQALLAELAPEAVVVLPLRGRQGTVGLLSLFNGAGRGPLESADLATAREVAARAGLALDNGRLYRQQRRLAEELQRSMLTAPPEPDHVEVVVRYQAATEAAQVGGDWYDAFIQPQGATVLVIGDVVGHDVAAAAAMGQVRSIVRTLGVDDDYTPAVVLARADRAMQRLQVSTTATAVVARVEQSRDQRSQGLTRLRWSNAGHPPPMVIHPDGSVALLLGAEPDLLLGISPGAHRAESEVTLDRGATVLLYTDGLVERRGQSLDEGLARLADTLGRLAAGGLTLDELCDRTLEAMLPERPDDDVALVAVRLHRQDRPRPAEAGPNRVPPHVPQDLS